MLNHHTYPTDPIRNKKTNAFDTSMASPSRQYDFAVRVSQGYIVTVAEFGRSRHKVWTLRLTPSLGALRWLWPVFKCMMMMSAFITYSSLVPLIEGLCSSNPWVFEYSGVRWDQTDDRGINPRSYQLTHAYTWGQVCVLGCQYLQTLWVLCSASGSHTRAWFSRNGFGHIWGGVLRHISTSLAITEWGLGVYSRCMTSCALVRLFRAGRSLGWGAGTLSWWSVSSNCRNVTSLMSTQACNATSRRIHDGENKACGHRASAGVLGNAPGWTSPHPPPARKYSSFRRPRSQRLGMAVHGPNKSTRRQRHHVLACSRQRRATPLSGRPPACFSCHHVPPFSCLVVTGAWKQNSKQRRRVDVSYDLSM